MKEFLLSPIVSVVVGVIVMYAVNFVGGDIGPWWRLVTWATATTAVAVLQACLRPLVNRLEGMRKMSIPM